MPEHSELLIAGLGVIFLLIGITGGGFKLKSIAMPPIGKLARVASIVIGIVLTLWGIASHH